MAGEGIPGPASSSHPNFTRLMGQTARLWAPSRSWYHPEPVAACGTATASWRQGARVKSDTGKALYPRHLLGTPSYHCPCSAAARVPCPVELPWPLGFSLQTLPPSLPAPSQSGDRQGPKVGTGQRKAIRSGGSRTVPGAVLSRLVAQGWPASITHLVCEAVCLRRHPKHCV